MYDDLRKLIEKELEWYYQNKGGNSAEYISGAIHGLRQAIRLLEKAETAAFNIKHGLSDKMENK